MKQYKRWIALALSLLGVLGCLAGCGAGDSTITQATPGTDAGQTESAPNGGETTAAAMGRYVEQSIPLPECQYAEDMVMLEDGRLRVALRRADDSVVVCTSGADRSTWDTTWEVPEEILATGSVSKLALSPDGNMFCHTREDAEENGNYGYHFWVISSDGTYREIPITYPDVDYTLGFLVPYCDFTDSGKLMVEFQQNEVCQVDLETGELGQNINELEPMLFKMGCAGENTYMIGWETVSANIDGQTAVLDNAMGQQLVDALRANEGNTPKIAFWENPEGYLFFITQDGLFSFVPGGSVVEELIDGSRTTLGDPRFLPVALTGGEDDTFYVLGSRGGDETMLLHYTYDATISTVSDTQLTIYSLYESEDLPQMISQYQVAHPEVMVDLQIGMTGEDGITISDAIRTLNTEILAGNGPDLICLDGFNLKTYMEKGLLADVSEILSQAEPTLTQVTKCYEQEGKLYAIPTGFIFPVMYGPRHIVSQIHDWDSLVAAGEQAKAERPDSFGVLGAFHPVNTADKLYDCYSSVWINPDGTVDEAKLAQFYAGMQKVFDLDAKLQEAWADRIYEDPLFYPGEYTGVLGSTLMGSYCMGFGTLNGMSVWANALAADQYLDDYTTARLELGDSGVFVPKGIMGILTTSKHPQAAGAFLQFMLSQQVQSKDLSYCFPVNQAVFDKETSEERVIDSYTSFTDADGNSIGVQAQYPDAEDRENLRTWVDNLTTPASTDFIIRSTVLDQMTACLLKEITPEEAAQNAMKTISLYLAE